MGNQPWMIAANFKSRPLNRTNISGKEPDLFSTSNLHNANMYMLISYKILFKSIYVLEKFIWPVILETLCSKGSTHWSHLSNCFDFFLCNQWTCHSDINPLTSNSVHTSSILQTVNKLIRTSLEIYWHQIICSWEN